MPRARHGEIEIEYESRGDPGNPTILLVMGFSLQMIAWDELFCDELVRRGFRVIRFDNRDVGLSSRIEGRRAPNVMALLSGDPSSAPYRLEDMARDAIAVLDDARVEAAHVVGVSMGGMIAQTMAIRHPKRVSSLASIMSTTGNRSVGNASPEVLPVVLAPTPVDRAGAIEHGVAVWNAIGSPGFPTDEAKRRANVAAAYDRSFNPAGVSRQFAAILAASDRTEALRSIDVPTLVIHGDSDRLIAPDGGEATARAVPGARWMLVVGMGHDLPEALWPMLLDAIEQNARRANLAN